MKKLSTYFFIIFFIKNIPSDFLEEIAKNNIILLTKEIMQKKDKILEFKEVKEYNKKIESIQEKMLPFIDQNWPNEEVNKLNKKNQNYGWEILGEKGFWRIYPILN